MNLYRIRIDSACGQRRGIHFIGASVPVWTMLFAIHATTLLPLAVLLARVLGIRYKQEGNPMGILLSINQMLYLPIVMWVYAAVPEKLFMVLAVVFGAHLLPFSWLYVSRTYLVIAPAVSLGALVLGLLLSPAGFAACMIGVQLAFLAGLTFENRDLAQQTEQEA